MVTLYPLPTLHIRRVCRIDNSTLATFVQTFVKLISLLLSSLSDYEYEMCICACV